MAISVAGVLAAGLVAAFVNTQVLGNNTSAAPVLAEGGQQTLPADTRTVTTAPTVTTPTTLPAVTTPTAPAQPTVNVVATQAVYTAAEAGSVTLDTAGDVLTIVAVVPTPGWIVTKSENEDSMNVEVKFQNGAAEVEFHANMQFGVVSPSVETKDGSVTSVSIDDNSGSGGGDSSGHGGGDDSGADNSGHGGGGDD
jgi:hypothetical protein